MNILSYKTNILKSNNIISNLIIKKNHFWLYV